MDVRKILRNLDTQRDLASKRLSAAAAELDRREASATRLYEPMPSQDGFHRSPATIRIIRAGVRSGKSYAVFQEVARACLRCDPYKKYTKDRPLVVWIVVFSEDNIGRTVYRMLFEPGCGSDVFIIRDAKTGKWRTYNPNNLEDVLRDKEKVIAPPMIPREEIKGFAWVKKGPRIFKSCRLKNGTEIRTFCSGSDPPMGDPIDLAVIDEDLKQDRRMISELVARISTRGGRIIWSVWPKTKNRALQKLSREASLQAGQEKPDVAEFRMRFSENKFVPEENKLQTMRLWAVDGEDVVRSRDCGDFLTDNVLMYPEYTIDIHGIPNVADPKCMDRSLYQGNLDWWLRTRQVPQDWTRIAWIDPGWGTTAVLFLAIPPPALGDCVVAYDELYLRNCKASTFGEQMGLKTRGVQFYAFGIDWRQARKHEQGSGKTIQQQFSEELKKRNVASLTTGSSFRKGSTDIQGRCTAVRSWLGIRDDGTPKFRILRSKYDDGRTACPYLDMEFGLYQRILHHDVAKEEPVDEHNHLANCLEYCAHDSVTKYHKVTGTGKEFDPVLDASRRWDAEDRQRSGGDSLYLGAGRGGPSQPRYH